MSEAAIWKAFGVAGELGGRDYHRAFTAASDAVDQRSEPLSLRLLDRTQSDVGDTPLHTAVRSVAVESVFALVDAGADVDAVNAWGETPRLLARRKMDVISKFLQAIR